MGKLVAYTAVLSVVLVFMGTGVVARYREAAERLAAGAEAEGRDRSSRVAELSSPSKSPGYAWRVRTRSDGLPPITEHSVIRAVPEADGKMTFDTVGLAAFRFPELRAPGTPGMHEVRLASFAAHFDSVATRR